MTVQEFYAKGKAGEPDILLVDDAMVQLEMMKKRNGNCKKRELSKLVI